MLVFLGGVLFFPPADCFSASTLQYSWNMDKNPGWTTEGLWAWGVPQGLGGGEWEGGPDPTSGYTGTHVYGYNLSGNYEPNLPATYLTTKAIDCTGLSNVTLKFQRWLGVEKYEIIFGDHADVEVSNNGSTWTTIANNVNVQYEDTSWHLTTLDIATVADGKTTVYIRWAMGPTDGYLNFCGFNIDDVEIWAERTSLPPPSATTGSATSVSSNSALLNGTVNPNGASTTVQFQYGLTTSYGSTVAAAQSPLSGTSAQAVSAAISGLTKQKTYHYRVAAANSAGTVYGGDRTFVTTVSCPECSGSTVVLTNVTFPSGKNCQCTATGSITIGTGVTIETGATVTFSAPTINLKPGFHAENGAYVIMGH